MFRVTLAVATAPRPSLGLVLSAVCFCLAGCSDLNLYLPKADIPNEAVRAELGRTALVIVDKRGPERHAGPPSGIDVALAYSIEGLLELALSGQRVSGNAAIGTVVYGAAKGFTAVPDERGSAIAHRVFPTFDKGLVASALLRAADQEDFQVPGRRRIAVLDLAQDVSRDEPLILRHVAAAGFDAALIVYVDGYALTGFSMGGQEEFLLPHVSVITRWFNVRTGELVYAQRWSGDGELHGFSDWQKEDFAALKESASRLAERFGRQLFTDLFLTQTFPRRDRVDESTTRLEKEGQVDFGFSFRKLCGLRPDKTLRPEGLFLQIFPGSVRPARMQSVGPVLRWETFPRPEDERSMVATELKEVADIRYDLKVWKVVENTFLTLVYERRGLIENQAAVSDPLDAGQVYAWSVRARYRFRGQNRVTHWTFVPYGEDTSASRRCLDPEHWGGGTMNLFRFVIDPK